MKKILLVVVLILSFSACTTTGEFYRSPMYSENIHVNDIDKKIVLKVTDNRLDMRLQNEFFINGWQVMIDNKGDNDAKYEMQVQVLYNGYHEYYGSNIKVFDLVNRKVIYNQTVRSGFGLDNTFLISIVKR